MGLSAHRGGQTPYAATGIYSLLLGFFVSLFCIILVSLATKAPDPEMLAEFERVATFVEPEEEKSAF